ncbi:hypothetical protein [Planococcus beigongshangi]|uniref:hypothetical protein n=1 Tax=Planococcus beigongshangi TaxID=2782536 RepID=UPI00193C7DC9|nr:hypothetical protein [Planococcus beigongshangi]
MKLKVVGLAIILLLGACSAVEEEPEKAVEQEVLEFNLNERSEIEKVTAYEVIHLAAGDQITPPNPGSVITTLEVDDPEFTYLDIIIDVKNLNTAEKVPEELLNITYTIGDHEYSTFQQVEYSNASMLRTGEFETIEPLKSAIVHYIAEVPDFERTEEIQIDVEIDGKVYTTTTTMDEYAKSQPVLAIGETIEVPQYADLTLDNVYYTDKVAPPNPGSFSTYYEPDAQSNMYLVLETTVENLKSTDLPADSVFAAKVIYEQYYEYSGFPTLLEADGSDLGYANITSIPSLNEAVVLYLVEVPKELKEKEGILSVWFNNDYYQLAINDQIQTKEASQSDAASAGEQNTASSQKSENEQESTSDDAADQPDEEVQDETADGSRKGHTEMTVDETLDLISYNEGIDFSTHSYDMSFDENGYLIIEVGQGEMAVGTYKIDSDGSLLQLDVVSGNYLPAEQVTDGGS